MSTPYEKPTDELRAVQFRSPIEKGGVGYINNQLVAIQRKWIVQDGETGTPYGNLYPKYREEWRDLPAVTWEESRK